MSIQLACPQKSDPLCLKWNEWGVRQEIMGGGGVVDHRAPLGHVKDFDFLNEIRAMESFEHRSNMI